MDINVTKESHGDGVDFLNTYHQSVSDDMSTKLIGNRTNFSYDIDSEHLFGGGSSTVANNINKSQYQASVNTSTKVNVSKTEFANFFDGTTLSDPESMLSNRFNSFSRYGYLDPAHEFITGAREFVFFSKPDLHLFKTDGSGEMYEKLSNNPMLVEAYTHYRYSCYCLQQYFGGNTIIGNDPSVGTGSNSVFDIRNKFIPILSNMVTSSFDLGDISAGETEGNRNLYQINTTYREGSIASDLQYDFSLEFKDTKYLDVYMIFKIYDEYFRHKYYEEIEPTREEYITSRIFPEAISIWKVIVDDTDRVIYWAKAIGCTPMSVPRGTLSNLEGTVKFTINWKAQFVREMDPINLMELNHLTQLSVGGNTTKKMNRLADGNTWVKYPWIATSESKMGINTIHRTGDNSTKPQMLYKLLWLS